MRKRGSKWGLFTAVLFGAVAVVYCSSRQRYMDQPAIVASDEPYHAYRPKKAPELPVIDPKLAFFDVDKSLLRADAKVALRPTAQWLKEHREVHLQIEGFCDERGSIPYNLELGSKRAAAAKQFLVSLGVAENRVSTVSYGRVDGGGKGQYAFNRRVGFVVIYPQTPPAAE